MSRRTSKKGNGLLGRKDNHPELLNRTNREPLMMLFSTRYFAKKYNQQPPILFFNQGRKHGCFLFVFLLQQNGLRQYVLSSALLFFPPFFSWCVRTTIRVVVWVVGFVLGWLFYFDYLHFSSVRML